MRDFDRPRFVARTEGASAAFIRELLRRAALLAADGGDAIVVEDRHIDEALHDLVVRGRRTDQEPARVPVADRLRRGEHDPS